LPDDLGRLLKGAAPTLDAVAEFGPTTRAVVVVDTSVSDADLKRMHEQGARGMSW
jgi:hypothetical protein